PGEVIDNVRLPALEHRESGRRVWDDQDLQALGLGLVPVWIVGPEVVAPLEHDTVAGVPFLYPVRSSSSRVFEVLRGAFEETPGIAVPVGMVPVTAKIPHEGRFGAFGFDKDL